MPETHPIPHTPDVLDELVEQLLDCGSVLSQMISGMVEFSESPCASRDAAPIPEIAHSLIHGSLTRVRRGYSRRDIRIAAKIVALVTAAITEEIYVVPLTAFEELYRSDAGGPQANDET